MLNQKLTTIKLVLQIMSTFLKTLFWLMVIGGVYLVLTLNVHAQELSMEEATEVELIKLRASDILYSEEKTQPILDGFEVIGSQDLVNYSYLGNEIDQSRAVFKDDNEYSNIENLGNNQYRIYAEPQFYKNTNGQVQEIIHDVVSKQVWDTTKIKTTVEKIQSLLKTPYVLADNYYSGAGNGVSARYWTDTTWSNCRNATDGLQSYYNYSDYYTDIIESSKISDPAFSCSRIFTPFDLTDFTIPEGQHIETVEMKYYFSTDNYVNTDSAKICVIPTSQSSNTEVVNSDFNNVSFTCVGDYVNMSSLTTGYNTLPMTATSVAESAWLQVGITTNLEVENIEPTGRNSIGGYFSGYTGTDHDPYLVITLAEDETPPEEEGGGGLTGVITCDSMMFNQKCEITSYSYASGTEILATTTTITTYSYMNLLVLLGELFICLWIILGLIKYKF